MPAKKSSKLANSWQTTQQLKICEIEKLNIVRNISNSPDKYYKIDNPDEIYLQNLNWNADYNNGIDWLQINYDKRIGNLTVFYSTEKFCLQVLTVFPATT